MEWLTVEVISQSPFAFSSTRSGRWNFVFNDWTSISTFWSNTTVKWSEWIIDSAAVNVLSLRIDEGATTSTQKENTVTWTTMLSHFRRCLYIRERPCFAILSVSLCYLFDCYNHPWHPSLLYSISCSTGTRSMIPFLTTQHPPPFSAQLALVDGQIELRTTTTHAPSIYTNTWSASSQIRWTSGSCKRRRVLSSQGRMRYNS